MVWSAHVTARDLQGSKPVRSSTRRLDHIFLLLSQSFEYSQMSQFWGGHGNCPCVSLVMTLTMSAAIYYTFHALFYIEAWINTASNKTEVLEDFHGLFIMMVSSLNKAIDALV